MWVGAGVCPPSPTSRLFAARQQPHQPCPNWARVRSARPAATTAGHDVSGSRFCFVAEPTTGDLAHSATRTTLSDSHLGVPRHGALQHKPLQNAAWPALLSISFGTRAATFVGRDGRFRIFWRKGPGRADVFFRRVVVAC